VECDELQQRLRRRERELEAVRRISAALYSRSDPGDVDELERQVLQVATETVESSDGTIYLHDPERRKLIFKYVIGGASDKLTGMEIEEDRGVVGSVFQRKAGRIDLDAAAAADRDRAIDDKTGYVTRNIVTVPLLTMGGQCIGVMQVLNKREGAFDEDDLEVLTLLARQAASAIESARLYRDQKLAEVVHRIGDISHDVKNMVTPIQTGTQTLEMMIDAMFEDLDRSLANGKVPPETAAEIEAACATVREFYQEAMQMNYDGVTATQERVKEIADSVKGIISAPHFEDADVREIIESVVRPLRLVAEPRGVSIDTAGMEPVPTAEIARSLILNVVYNLINNAIPYTPSGGFVYVRTRLTRPEEDEHAPRLQIEVADTGRGIPPHILEKLFTGQAVSDKVGGTGLGTQIVRRGVDAHHGQITVTSELGHGATFTIRLPLRQPAADKVTR
jgi:signal transduction histidine kinase